MKIIKNITINLGQYQTVRIGVEDVATFDDADAFIIEEIQRMKLPVNDKVKQVLKWS